MKRTELEWARSVVFPISVSLPSLVCAMPVFAVLILYIFIIKKNHIILTTKNNFPPISYLRNPPFLLHYIMNISGQIKWFIPKIETQE